MKYITVCDRILWPCSDHNEKKTKFLIDASGRCRVFVRVMPELCAAIVCVYGWLCEIITQIRIKYFIFYTMNTLNNG